MSDAVKIEDVTCGMYCFRDDPEQGLTIGTCLTSKQMGHRYTHRTIGQMCPFQGNIDKCNKDYATLKFKNDQELKEYLRTGRYPGHDYGEKDMATIIDERPLIVALAEANAKLGVRVAIKPNIRDPRVKR